MRITVMKLSAFGDRKKFMGKEYDGLQNDFCGRNGIIDEVIDKVQNYSSYRSDLDKFFLNIKALI
jgi:hypothetical protein